MTTVPSWEIILGEYNTNVNVFPEAFRRLEESCSTNIVAAVLGSPRRGLMLASRGTTPLSRDVRWLDSSATITPVKKQPAGFRRRKLSTVVRKAITSYYTDQEQVEIEKAAKQQKISMSSFVASASLKEARRLVR